MIGVRGAGAAALTAVALGAAAGCGAASHSSTSPSYCAYLNSIQPRAGSTFDSEGYVLRSTSPLAPPALRGDYATALMAFEQIQDRADGTISADQVTLIGTERLARAMADIDAYAVQQCGVHVAQMLPQASNQ